MGMVKYCGGGDNGVGHTQRERERGETLHMSQQEKSQLWIHSSEETSSLNSRFEILCACALLYTAKTHARARVRLCQSP